MLSPRSCCLLLKPLGRCCNPVAMIQSPMLLINLERIGGTVRQYHSSDGILSSSSSSSSSVASFFGYTSGRARRRRQHRRRRQREEQHQSEAVNDEDTDYFQNRPDHRTVRELLFPKVHDDNDMLQKTPWPKSYAEARTVGSSAWKMYRSTWDGFFTSKGVFVEENSKVADNDGHDRSATNQPPPEQEIRHNTRRNARFVSVQANALREQVRDTTGIHNVDDLKRVATEAMKLASACVREFIAGYRKGRDDEVDKMLTQYFREWQDKVDDNTPAASRRRKIKRRTHRVMRS